MLLYRVPHRVTPGGGGSLTFAESSFTYEYAACGGAVLTNCALIDEETAPLYLLWLYLL